MSSRIGLGRHIDGGDASGDPLDGLVNLFDIGIVLAVAFLIAGLGLTLNAKEHRLQKRTSSTQSGRQQALPAPTGAPSKSGSGQAVGTVYRLANGQLVFVKQGSKP
ncbi:MAG TPA: DUF2149 domain-containing protein [Solirubrobacteraceae bacterium]|jgi:hypothetical protein